MTATASTVFIVLVALAARLIDGNAKPLWLVARSSGLAAYVLLTLAVLAGLLLSNRCRVRFRPSASRIRVHIGLVVFALVFTVLHLVVLVLDPYAQVGWAGALLPMGAGYRPVPVTLGVLAFWSGLVSGLSAAMAGRGTGRLWLTLHRVAAVGWLLAWFHGVLSGIDTKAMVVLYTSTGMAVIAAGVWRYLTREKAVAAAQEGREVVMIR